MGIFSSISVRSKMLLVAVLPFVVLAILGAIALGGMKDIAKGGERLYEDRIVPLQTLKEVTDAYAQFVLSTGSKAAAGILPAGDAQREIQAARERIQREWHRYEKLDHSEQERVLVRKVATAIGAADSAIDSFQGALSTPSGDLNQALQQLYTQVEPASTMVTELAQQELNLSSQDYQEMQAVYAGTRQWFLLGTLLALLVLGVVNLMIYLAITRPIRALRDVFQAVSAQHDLSLRAPVLSSDGIGVAAEAFNSLMDSFQQLVVKISQTSATLHDAADELSQVSTTTGKVASEQQGETEHVAGAVREMTATVQDVARSAAEAAAAARQADQQTQKGDKVVHGVISSIQRLAAQIQTAASVVEELESETMSIGSVLDVIRNIAEQTNLLALNAAIEAARAGEQGRGFAVVADEVRTLASRTQKSTQEIQKMIERLQAGAKNAVEAMEQGKGVADSTSGEAREAGNALSEALRAVATISDMNTQIASAAEEQTAVAEQIGSKITNISKLSIKTSEGAEQVTRSGTGLAQLAQDLRLQTGSYKG